MQLLLVLVQQLEAQVQMQALERLQVRRQERLALRQQALALELVQVLAQR